MLRAVINKMMLALLGLLFIGLIWFLSAMSRAVVELTEGGVYQRIYIPIGKQKVAWRADLAIRAKAPSLSSIQGPIVEGLASGGYRVSWYCGARAFVKELADTKISIECDALDRRYYWQAQTEIGQTSYTSNNTLVISDLEGNLDYFLAWGRKVGVLDGQGNWAFGSGHLVILGDSVDRGRRVFDLLWKLYELEIQASRAGGELHLVLGNHEQYVFRGQISKVEPEHLWATEQLMPYQEAFSEQSILGRWLRDKPIALVLNETLFVHGGVSPTLIRKNLSIDHWNQLHRTALAESNYGEPDLFGPESFTQYRGYFYANSSDPKADQAAIGQTLASYQVRQIVVGHTKVDSITPYFENRLYAIETADSTDQYLHIIDGKPSVKQSGVIKHHFKDRQLVHKPFDMRSSEDWSAFYGVFTTAARNAFSRS